MNGSVKEPNILIYFFFPPITRWCSISRMVFEAEASGGGSKAGGVPHPSLSLPSPFPFPLSFQTNQWEGRSDPVRGKFPGFPPTNTSLSISDVLFTGGRGVSDFSVLKYY